MFTYTVTQSVTPASGILSSAVAYSNAYTQELKDEAIADGATDFEINFGIIATSVIVWYMVSTVNLDVKQDAGVNPVVISLVPNLPYLWTTDSYDTFKFTDFAKLLVTNNDAGSAGVLNIRCLSDATP